MNSGYEMSGITTDREKDSNNVAGVCVARTMRAERGDEKR